MSVVPLLPAEGLVAMIDNDVDGVAGVLWERRDFDSIPAGAVGVPSLRRREPDEKESQLGSFDWFLDYPISLYFKLEDAVQSQQRMVEALAALGAAIDADPTLRGTVFDAAIASAEPFVETDRRVPLCGYQVVVATLKFVPQS